MIKTTTETDRVISLLEASITDPVAEIANAPHLEYPLEIKRLVTTRV